MLLVVFDPLGSGIGKVWDGGWVLMVARNGLENVVVGD